MAERILTAQGPAARTLVIAGSAHTALAPTGLGIPLGARLAEQRSGVREVQVRYGNGGYYNVSPQRFKRQWSLRRRVRLRLEGAGLVLDVPSPVQARVPHRVQPNQRPLRPAAPGFTGAFPAYQDAQPLTGPQRRLGTGPFPAQDLSHQGQPRAYQEQPRPYQERPQRHTGSSPALPYPDPAYPGPAYQDAGYQDDAYPGSARPGPAYQERTYPDEAHQAQHAAQHRQPRPGSQAEPGYPPFMGHTQPPAGPTGNPARRRRVLPYEVELPTR